MASNEQINPTTMEEVIIPFIVFSSIVIVIYLFISSRHRERMALIDKGQDASLFYSSKSSPGKMRRMLFVNIAFTAIGIGIGITTAIFLDRAIGEDAIYPALIFTMGGLGLLAGVAVNRNWDKQEG